MTLSLAKDYIEDGIRYSAFAQLEIFSTRRFVLRKALC